MSRPEYIKCIAHTHADHPGKSWCGRSIGFEFHFTNIDHAVYNAMNEGRLVACPKCCKAVRTALT